MRWVRDQRLYLVPGSPAAAVVLESFGLAEQYRPGEYRLGVEEGGARYVLATGDGIVLERGVPGDSMGRRLGFAWKPPAGLAPGESVGFTILTVRDAARRLAQEIQVAMDLDGNFLRVELRGVDPERIAETLNGVA